MAITLQSIVRENGGGCNHFVITADDSGTTRQVRVTLQDITDGREDANYKLNIVLFWLRYQLQENGKTPAQIIQSLPQVVIS